MSENCKHCNHEIELNFCPNCGQRRLKRIDRAYIKDELQYTVLHMNKGFLYSIKCLIKSPGKTARAFIEGDRVHHYKPILLVFVLSGITAFLLTTFVDGTAVMEKYYSELLRADDPNTKIQIETMKIVYSFMMKYYSLVMLAFVPIMAFFTYLGFRKWGLNYYEHVIMNAYYLSYYLVINIVVAVPLQYFLQDHPQLFVWVPSLVMMILGLAQVLIFFIGFFSERDPGQVVLRLFLLVVIGGVAYIVISILLGIAIAIYAINNNLKPEELMFGTQTAKDSISLLLRL